jgi:hypothetical protein
VLLALACVAGIAVLRAQETPPASAETAPAAEPGATDSVEEGEKIEFPDAPDPNAAPSKPQAPATTEAPAAAVDDEGDQEVDEEEPPPETAPRTPGVVGDTPGRFEPTERVRADFDVSFPVDI